MRIPEGNRKYGYVEWWRINLANVNVAYIVASTDVLHLPAVVGSLSQVSANGALKNLHHEDKQ